MKRRNPRATLAGAGAVVVALAGAVFVAWLLWPHAVSAPRARQYLNVSACLLTDPAGVTPGTAGASVWTAMESASRTTHVMVSYLPDAGPADVTPMLNTLVERQCGVIITTAGASARAVIAVAKANPSHRFLLVGAASSTGLAVPANAVVVRPASAAVRIAEAIHALAAQA